MRAWGELLRETERCLYCGFCEPHCPTLRHGPHRGYGPRGRVTVIQLLASGAIDAAGAALEAVYTCLLCRRCEAHCPPGIGVAELVRAARALLAAGLGAGGETP